MEKEKANKRKLSPDIPSEEIPTATAAENEQELDLNCDEWDKDCVIATTKPKSSIRGYHLMPTCSRDPEQTPKRMKLVPEMRANLLSDCYKCELKNLWRENKAMKSCGMELIESPFKVCVINNFLENPAFLKDVREEFNELDWNLRSMDLYEFAQSKDLKCLSQENIGCLYRFLHKNVMKWVAEITGLKLTHISATCSVYNNTDYLLVHDDQMSDRMVAFILYLSENWSESKGGALQLFDRDQNGQPSSVVRSVFPANNQFVFFPVSNHSYHQVSEVTSFTDSRLSINGWFHAKFPSIYTSPAFQPYPEGLYGSKSHRPIDSDCELCSWITEIYLEKDTIEEIQEYFEDNSEISLKNFLRAEPFNELLELLKSDMLTWLRIGPPNRYNYEVLQTNDLPVVFDRLFQLFQSKQMFQLLKKFTGVELKEEKASMKFEFQRWTPGCYSLLGDYDWYDKKQLDLMLNFDCKSNSDVIGARTLYVTTDEEEQDALITLEPEENNLNLIYRDTARFTKYFSKLSNCKCFYTLFCCYTE